jgi:hypothetical protein
MRHIVFSRKFNVNVDYIEFDGCDYSPDAEIFTGPFRSVIGLIHKALEDRPELFQSSGFAGGGTERAVVIECC